MTLPQVKTGPRRFWAAAPVGLAIALTMGAVGAGYVAGKMHTLGVPAIAMTDGPGHAGTHAAEAQMEGLLLLLLDRGGVL